MSKELKNLEAKIEIAPNKRKDINTPEYINTKVSLTSFYGGKSRKLSLQITFKDEDGNYKHIQLDNKNVKKLQKIIENEF